MKINKKLIVPFIIAISTYLLAYQIPKFTIPEYRLHYLKLPIDDLIKLWSPMFVVYIGAFFQWAYTVIVSCRQKTEKGYKHASAIIIGSLIGFIIFVVYPTAIVRPEIIGNSLFDEFARFIYSVDNVICACPSFHCFCSTISILMLEDCEGVSKKCLYINMFISLLVFVSTLLTKQHVIIDIPFGILLAFVAMWISKTIRFDMVFDRLNKTFKV